jgi:cytochrome c oxidase subunit IV
MERDDCYEYSLDYIHGEEEGKKIVKRFNFVILFLSAVTIVELTLGFMVAKGSEWWTVTKWTFLALTLVKAGYIVLEFMHLGDERKQLRWIILIPYISFISYLVFICLWESTAMFNIFGLYKHF